MNKRFNIRVYGLWIHNSMVLVNEEVIRGFNRTVVKFPGGGLEQGEGTIDCLKREWKEELGIDIGVLQHFTPPTFTSHRHLMIRRSSAYIIS
jgi:8-oxo-dGTP diphosphatase